MINDVAILRKDEWCNIYSTLLTLCRLLVFCVELNFIFCIHWSISTPRSIVDALRIRYMSMENCSSSSLIEAKKLTTILISLYMCNSVKTTNRARDFSSVNPIFRFERNRFSKRCCCYCCFASRWTLSLARILWAPSRPEWWADWPAASGPTETGAFVIRRIVRTRFGFLRASCRRWSLRAWCRNPTAFRFRG